MESGSCGSFKSRDGIRIGKLVAKAASNASRSQLEVARTGGGPSGQTSGSIGSSRPSIAANTDSGDCSPLHISAREACPQACWRRTKIVSASKKYGSSPTTTWQGCKLLRSTCIWHNPDVKLKTRQPERATSSHRMPRTSSHTALIASQRYCFSLSTSNAKFQKRRAASPRGHRRVALSAMFRAVVNACGLSSNSAVCGSATQDRRQRCACNHPGASHSGRRVQLATTTSSMTTHTTPPPPKLLSISKTCGDQVQSTYLFPTAAKRSRSHRKRMNNKDGFRSIEHFNSRNMYPQPKKWGMREKAQTP
mmetsp:Transcript_72829/g.167185  ORF Transcript_72829/g.167185 Transcript_72829/m.167185 type:complete len:307 (-) Transcript_72829:1599-2519(-)